MPDPFKDQLLGLLPKLRSYALGLTGSASEADDLVQEALVRAWRSRAGFDGANLKAWTYRILRNCFIDQMNLSRKTVQDVEGRLAATLVSKPEQEWRLQYSDMLAAMGEISSDCREALLLVVAQGLSYEEAAEICSCPVGTLKSRVNRARDQLARRLGREPLSKVRARVQTGFPVAAA